jgi:hypothetical protein
VTAGSTTSEETLAFGKSLVVEYQLEPTVDTLGKWMVHHIAELIEDAEGTTGPDRPSKVVAAIQAILAFWDHRATVDRIDPLRDLKPLLRVIKTLDPEDNRWGIYFRRDGYGAIAEVYDAFRKLVIFELVRQSERTIDLAKTSDFVGDEERSIIEALNLWIAGYQKEALQDEDSDRAQGAADEMFDAKAHALQAIDNARHALDALADEILGKPRARLDAVNTTLLRKIFGNKTPEILNPEIEIVSDLQDKEDN